MPTMPNAHHIGAISLLEEPLRRRLYDYVRSRTHAVGRDEAATAVGVSRSTAAFHLDRLEEAGLLTAEYRRLTGRTGRGAGRPAKVYRASEVRLSVSVPESRYELAGRILAEALDRKRPRDDAEAAVRRAAGRYGLELGRELRERLHARGRGALRLAQRVMQELGFEPQRRKGEMVLRNCPFHELAVWHPRLVCAMNHAFVLGLLSALEQTSVTAELRRDPGYCCVTLTRIA